MRGKIIYITIAVLFAICSLVNVSGYGQAIQSNKLLVYVLLLFSAFILMFIQKKKEKTISGFDFVFILIITLIFELSSYLQNFAGSGLGFLSFFLCVYIFSILEQREFNLYLCSLIYFGFGFGILAIMNFTDILSGWNPNSISIICLQAFLIFFATFKRENIYQVMLYIFAILFFTYYLWNMNCRSAMLCVILAAVTDLLTYTRTKLLTNKLFIFLILILPLLVALTVVLFSNSSVFESLNEWTMNIFEKSIFNGRDNIWHNGLEKLMKKPLFGHGEIYLGYWHNSAVACLYSYGIIGYIFYVIAFSRLLFSGINFMYDSVIRRCTVAFLILNFQQSFENTIFVIGGIYLPYVLLGILVGRVNFLRKEQENAKTLEYNNSCI